MVCAPRGTLQTPRGHTVWGCGTSISSLVGKPASRPGTRTSQSHVAVSHRNGAAATRQGACTVQCFATSSHGITWQGLCVAISQGTVRVTVEEDPNWLSPYGAARDSHGRALYSAVVTLTLGVLGRCAGCPGKCMQCSDVSTA